MLVILPISCWCLLWLSCFARGKSWRKAHLQACVLLGTFTVAITEGLSSATALTQTNVIVFWIVGLVCSAFWVARSKISLKLIAMIPRVQMLKTLVAIALIVVLLLVVALWCAPNNYDSLTYHLSRVEHWVANKSVAHYPVHVLRQLTLNPGAEYLLLNLRLLTKSDLFANSLQWWSMLGCVVGTSLLAKQLGADARGQVLSSVICLTIPIGLLEATSTQNDYVASFWLVCVASFCLSWGCEKTESFASEFEQAVWLGLALGLALLTKGTNYFFAFAPMVLLAVALWKRLKLRGIAPFVVTCILAAVMNFPFMLRNVQTFGAPMVDRCIYEAGYRASNEGHAPKYLASNLLRTFADEVQAPIPIWNRFLFGGIEKIHEVLHWNANDPACTFEGITFASVHPGFMFQEDIAGNPLHTFLFVFAIGILVASKKFPERRLLFIYCGSIIAAFVFFNAVLKWQPWHSRLLLPLYVSGAAFVGCVAGTMSVRFCNAMIVVLLVCAIPYLLINPNKLLIGNENIFMTRRTENYFRSVPNFYAPYVKACEFFEQQHADVVGVASDDTSWAEYPLWTMLSRNFSRPIRVEGLSLKEWKTYPGKSPDALISYDRKPPEVIELPSRIYRKTFNCDSTSDRFTYHFFGKEVGKTYNHLSMAVYMPEQSQLHNNPVKGAAP